MLKCTLSVTRYKGPCFAQFGEATVSKALSVKNAHLLLYVIFCANMCFVYGRGGYWEAKHEVEKIWFWWQMSGQLEMCALSSVFAVLRSFYSFLLLQLHLALRCYFSYLIAFLKEGMELSWDKTLTHRGFSSSSVSASVLCYPWDWRASRRSLLRAKVLQWDAMLC